jgi:hypothetical protein
MPRRKPTNGSSAVGEPIGGTPAEAVSVSTVPVNTVPVNTVPVNTVPVKTMPVASVDISTAGAPTASVPTSVSCTEGVPAAGAALPCAASASNELGLTKNQALRLDLLKFIMSYNKNLISSFSITDTIVKWLKD